MDETARPAAMLSEEHRARPAGLDPAAHAVRSLFFLALVLFTVSSSASAISTLLPEMLSGFSLPQQAQEKHAAFLTGGYLLAMFAAGPAFGYLSDSIGRRPVLLGGLAVFTASLYALIAASSLLGLYVSRILSGLGAGALLPVMLAHVSEHSAEPHRVRRFAWLVSAAMLGSIVGPYLAGLAARPDAWDWAGIALPPRPIAVPVLAGAIASSIALGAMLLALPRRGHDRAAFSGRSTAGMTYRPSALYALFMLSVLLMYAVGAFEVGLATLSRQKLKLDTAELGMMYTTCAVVMLLMQALFFADPFKDFADRHLLFPGFVVTAIALALFPFAADIDGLAWVVAAVAGGAGLIAPILSYRVSLLANGRQGKSFGLQSASSNLGQALGSAGSGVLIGLDPHWPYWLAAAFLAMAAIWILLRMRPAFSPDIGQRPGLD